MSVAANASAYFSLTRPRLLPSALADVIAGTTLAGGITQCAPMDLARGLVFSLLIYAGGMAANDVADAAEDTRLKRARPIPMGRVRRSTAALFATLLLVAATLVAPPPLGLLPFVLLGAVLTYDFVAKRHVWLGAPVLGLCRSLNLLTGVLLAGNTLPGAPWTGSTQALELAVSPGALGAVLLGYGAYTGIAVIHGALEDRVKPSPRLSMRWLLLAASIPFLVAIVLETPHWAALAAVPTLVLCARASSAGEAWVSKRTGILLRGLSRFGFVVACGMSAWIEASILAIPAWILPWLFRPKHWS